MEKSIEIRQNCNFVGQLTSLFWYFSNENVQKYHTETVVLTVLLGVSETTVPERTGNTTTLSMFFVVSG
jgi:hypothetical protein